MNTNKKEIREELYINIDIDNLLDGSLQKVSQNILNIEERLKTEHRWLIDNPSKYIRFELEGESHYDESFGIKVYGVRMETDEEYDKRIEKVKKASEASKLAAKKKMENLKEKELKELKRLQEKYKL